MGPEPNNKQRSSAMDPPVYNPETDLQVWHKQIESWVDLISAAAEKGTDKMYKTIFATLGRQLYDCGLPEAQKHIVDETRQKGLIDYRQGNQVEAVRQIVKLFAVDPPIAVVTSMITSFNKVSQSHRRRNEDLNSFVSRFRCLAAQHLMNAGVEASSQIGEVLAIHLLNNADLGENTHTFGQDYSCKTRRSPRSHRSEVSNSPNTENTGQFVS